MKITKYFTHFFALFLLPFSTSSQELFLPQELCAQIFTILCAQSETYKNHIETIEKLDSTKAEIEDSIDDTLLNPLKELIVCIHTMHLFASLNTYHQNTFMETGVTQYQRILTTLSHSKKIRFMTCANYRSILHTTFFHYIKCAFVEENLSDMQQVFVEKEGRKKLSTLINKVGKPSLLFFTDIISLCWMHRITRFTSYTDTYENHMRANQDFLGLVFKYIVLHHTSIIQNKAIHFLSYVTKKSALHGHSYYKNLPYPLPEKCAFAPLEDYTFEFDIKGKDFTVSEAFIHMCKQYGIALHIPYDDGHPKSQVYYGGKKERTVPCAFIISPTLFLLGPDKLLNHTLFIKKTAFETRQSITEKEEEVLKTLFFAHQSKLKQIIQSQSYTFNYSSQDAKNLLNALSAIIHNRKFSDEYTCYMKYFKKKSWLKKTYEISYEIIDKEGIENIWIKIYSSRVLQKNSSFSENDLLELFFLLEKAAYCAYVYDGRFSFVTEFLQKSVTESIVENDRMLEFASYFFNRITLLCIKKNRSPLIQRISFKSTIDKKNLPLLQERCLHLGIPFWVYYKQEEQYIRFVINDTINLFAPTDLFYLQEKTYNIPPSIDQSTENDNEGKKTENIPPFQQSKEPLNIKEHLEIHSASSSIDQDTKNETIEAVCTFSTGKIADSKDPVTTYVENAITEAKNEKDTSPESPLHIDQDTKREVIKNQISSAEKVNVCGNALILAAPTIEILEKKHTVSYADLSENIFLLQTSHDKDNKDKDTEYTLASPSQPSKEPLNIKEHLEIYSTSSSIDQDTKNEIKEAVCTVSTGNIADSNDPETTHVENAIPGAKNEKDTSPESPLHNDNNDYNNKEIKKISPLQPTQVKKSLDLKKYEKKQKSTKDNTSKETMFTPLKSFFYRCTVKIRLLFYYCLNNFMHCVSLLF